MKLLNQLKNLIINETGRRESDGTTLFSKVIDNKLIQLKSTYHQRKERFGGDTYDEIVDKYQEFLDTRKSKFAIEPRLAVPDTMIRTLFSNNVEKIYDSYEKENPQNNQIIFVHRRKENEDNKKFNFMEVLFKKKGNFFSIITSAFSDDGEFLKTKNEEKKSNRIRLEQKFINEIKIIYI